MDASRGASGTVLGERPTTLPEGIVDLPPGPRLAALLESIDQFDIDVDEMEYVLQARARQIWHLQAEQMVDLYLTAHGVWQRIGPSEPPALRGPHTSEYVGWRLRCSARWAQAQIDMAEALLTRFPEVFTAMSEGRLDPARAKAFVELLSGVEDEATVQWIVDRLLPKAPGWTLAELRERLRYHVDRRAPKAARRRYQQRVVERNVELRPEPEGTATLAGVGLPPHRAAAAFDRIDRLARAARAAGDPRTITQLRGDAFTDLLAGVPFQVTPSVDPLTADADAQHPQPERAPGDGGPDGGPWEVPPEEPNLIDEYEYERWFEPTDDDQRWADQHWADRDQAGADQDARDQPNGTQDHARAERIRAITVDSRCETGNVVGGVTARRLGTAGSWCGPGNSGGDGRSRAADSRFETGNRVGGVTASAVTAAGSSCGPGDRATTPADRWAIVDSWFETGNSVGAAVAGDRCGRCGGGLAPPRPGAVQVSVTLATLLGRDDHPGLMVGIGPVLADIARQIATDPVLNPLWRWSVFDPHGELLHHGTTTRRPPPATRPAAGSATPSPEWACTCPRIEPGERRSVVEIQLTLADLAADQVDDGWRSVVADIAAQVDGDIRANPPGKWSEVDERGQPRHHGHTGRHPNAEEAAFIRARDRTCRAPHCRRPASTCDLDHAVEHRRGGPSHRGNCRCLCRRHHTLRHAPGVIVADEQTDRGHITVWTLPDGRTYRVTRDKDIIVAIDND